MEMFSMLCWLRQELAVDSKRLWQEEFRGVIVELVSAQEEELSEQVATAMTTMTITTMESQETKKKDDLDLIACVALVWVVDRFVLAHPEIAAESASGETDSRRRRLLHEDAWMQAQGPTSEFRFNLNQNNPFLRLSAETPLFRATTIGTDRDFLWGFLLGFFVGFLMLVWVWMPTVPHKQKLGILTGISFQLAMNFLKDNPDESDFVEDWGQETQSNGTGPSQNESKLWHQPVHLYNVIN
jgi:DUF2407 C-terminal domain